MTTTIHATKEGHEIVSGPDVAPGAFAPTCRYYVLQGRMGGLYYSHRVGSAIHKAKQPGDSRIIFCRREDAEAFARQEGSAAWQVASFDAMYRPAAIRPGEAV